MSGISTGPFYGAIKRRKKKFPFPLSQKKGCYPAIYRGKVIGFQPFNFSFSSLLQPFSFSGLLATVFLKPPAKFYISIPCRVLQQYGYLIILKSMSYLIVIYICDLIDVSNKNVV